MNKHKRGALRRSLAGTDTPAGFGARVRDLALRELSPLVLRIDREGLYPADVMRSLGRLGGFRQHLSSRRGDKPLGLGAAIEAIAAVGETCLSTAFLVWCQDACGWYLENSPNVLLRERDLPAIADGSRFGGTALSNPMKHYAGIEPLRLTGTPVNGGYLVNGSLPWVSNLGEHHAVGAIFHVEGKAPRDVMALLDCAAPGLDLVQSVHFTALEGTRTFAMRLRDVFVSEAQVLADPVEGFIPRIRAGFVLLQLGMALGLVQGCIDNIERSGRSRREINRYLPDQVPDLTEALDALRTETLQLARTPWEADPSYMHRVWRARLTGAELSLRAAQGAMLHAGASGYTVDAPAQRRLREAYFIAIVTPSVKHLHKVLTTATAFSDVHHAKEALRMT